jgi:hypothetical protein
MSTRAQQAQILRSQPVLDQLTGCLLNAASQIVHEDPNTPNHESRIKYANAVLIAPAPAAQFIMPALLTNATLASQAGNAPGDSGTPFADSDVDYVVASVFDIYANQFSAQQAIGANLQFGTPSPSVQ